MREQILNGMKPELGHESKDGVPFKANRKHELVTQNDGFTPQMLDSTQNTSETLQGYFIALHVRNFSSVRMDRQTRHTIIVLMPEVVCMIAKR